MNHLRKIIQEQLKELFLVEGTSNYWPGYSDDNTADWLAGIRDKTSPIQNKELKKALEKIVKGKDDEFWNKWQISNMITTSLQDGFYIDKDLIEKALVYYKEILGQAKEDKDASKYFGGDQHSRNYFIDSIEYVVNALQDEGPTSNGRFYLPGFMDTAHASFKDTRKEIDSQYKKSGLQNVIRESILLAENIQQADKIYFSKGLLSPRVREIIMHITGGDAWTKLLTDIYYAEMMQWKKTGHWAVNAFDGDNHEPEPEEYHKPGQDDVMNKEDWKRMRQFHNQLKEYNTNIFPVKGFNINGVKDIWDLITALKQRAKILEDFKKLPSIAIRNMKSDIRQPRNSSDMNAYRDSLEHFLAYYSQLGNRAPKFRKAIENKMFRAGVTLNDLLNFVEEKENLVGGKNFTKNIIKRLAKENDYDMDVVYDHGNVMVVDIQSPDAIKKIGCNSLWCFTYGQEFRLASNNWNNYSTNDHVYVIINFAESPDSPEFMHVLIKPLDYTTPPSDEGDINDSKLFNMANEESYNALGVVEHLIGDQAPYIMHFDEPVNKEGPTSKWPHEDPNQLKMDLKEIRRMIREEFLNEAKKSKFKKLKDNKVPLTDEERKKVMDADAVWHHGLNGAPSPAVWKSVAKDGEVTYVTNTHRAFQDRPTLKGAISIYHSFIKGTS